MARRASSEGASLTLQSFTKILRARWLVICASVLIAAVAAVVVSLVTTPKYEASTRLFVSASSGGGSLSEKYSGTLDSQQRVLSYTQLVTGETLAERTIDKLGLDIAPSDLVEKIKATAKPDTVLIDVTVEDESPVRARDIANTLSDEFVGMVRELETPEDGSPPDVRVIVEHRASVPPHPFTPNKLRNIAVGIALGLVVGFGLAFLRDYFDNTVKDRETLEEITHVGLVGSIPLDKERRREPTISFDSDSSAIAEAFRKFRTNLQFLAVDNPPRVIVIASSLPSEGKSTTAINIALALAEAEHNVVLVDGDMRRPMLDKYLDVVGSVGFSTVLSGGATLPEVLQKTGVAGLTILASGPVPPNPSELLGSQAAKKVLSELKGQFDYVIVDSSPLLAVTDAAILSASSDGVLLIARFGQTKRDQLAHAMRNLADVDAALLGAVFTMTPARRHASYSYSYYGNNVAKRPPSTSSQRSLRKSRGEETKTAP